MPAAHMNNLRENFYDDETREDMVSTSLVSSPGTTLQAFIRVTPE